MGAQQTCTMRGVGDSTTRRNAVFLSGGRKTSRSWTRPLARPRLAKGGHDGADPSLQKREVALRNAGDNRRTAHTPPGRYKELVARLTRT